MKTMIVWLLLSQTQANDLHVHRAVFHTAAACTNYIAATHSAHTDRRCVRSFVVIPTTKQ